MALPIPGGQVYESNVLFVVEELTQDDVEGARERLSSIIGEMRPLPGTTVPRRIGVPSRS